MSCVGKLPQEYQAKRQQAASAHENIISINFFARFSKVTNPEQFFQ